MSVRKSDNLPTPDPNGHGLPELTDKAKFCCTYFFENKCSKYEAYVSAFGKGNQSTKSLYENASRFFAKDQVKNYLTELRAELRARAMVTLEEHIDELRRLRDLAVSERQLSAAVAAETNVGKVSGLYIDQIHLLTPKVKPALIIVRPGESEVKGQAEPELGGEDDANDD